MKRNRGDLNIKRWGNEIIFRYGTTLYTFYTDDMDLAIERAIEIINEKEHLFD